MPKSQLSRSALMLLIALSLTACETLPEREAPPPSCPVATPCPACPVCPSIAPPVEAAAKPLQTASWEDLPGWREDNPAEAWEAFLQSCRGLNSKERAGWQRVCDLARSIDGKNSAAVRRFLEAELTPFALTAADGSQEGLITGYYEPLLRGSRQPGKRYSVPVLGVPDDLITVDLAEVVPELKHLRLRGRLQGNRLLPYYSRAEIEARSAPQKTLLWVDDAIELFFLQIQGSGRVRLPDGSLVRLGYADQNGHPYRSIGRALIERGELKPHEASMQGIQAWARSHPEQLRELLDLNPSYVFFRELPAGNDGPLGSLGVPLTAGRSLAVDPRFVPLGAPVFLATTRPGSQTPLRRLMLAQDTGGAIKGAIRADYFWGFGPQAGEQAGRMKQTGRLWVLLPAELAPK